MPFGNFEGGPVQNVSETQYLQFGGQRVLDHLRMPGAPGSVHHEAGEFQVPVERQETLKQRNGASRHAPNIDDQDDRYVQQLRDECRAAAFGTVFTVIERAHRLDQGDVRAGGELGERRYHVVHAHHPEVKIDRWSAGGFLVTGGVDESDFERLHRQPRNHGLPQERQGHGGLPDTAVRAGYDV